MFKAYLHDFTLCLSVNWKLPALQRQFGVAYSQPGGSPLHIELLTWKLDSFENVQDLNLRLAAPECRF